MTTDDPNVNLNDVANTYIQKGGKLFIALGQLALRNGTARPIIAGAYYRRGNWNNDPIEENFYPGVEHQPLAVDPVV